MGIQDKIEDAKDQVVDKAQELQGDKDEQTSSARGSVEEQEQKLDDVN